MNKIKTYLIAAIVLASNLTWGQCPPRDVTLESQSDISEFLLNYPNCEDLNGSLYISGDSVTDISGLSNIKTIAGSLSFHKTACKVVSFPYLTIVNGDVFFHQNYELDSVDLWHLDGTVDLVYFHQNITLKQVKLCSVDSINEKFYFYQNDQLNDLCFDQLTGINEYLVIHKCTGLTNLNTFSNLRSVGEYLSITNNSSLTDCSGLCPLLNADGVNGEISFLNSPVQCSSQSQITSFCPIVHTNDLSFDGDFVVFPNPTTGPINIIGFEYDHIAVFDISGKLVKQELSKNLSLDISELEVGVYLVRFNSKKSSITKRVLKF